MASTLTPNTSSGEGLDTSQSSGLPSSAAEPSICNPPSELHLSGSSLDLLALAVNDLQQNLVNAVDSCDQEISLKEQIFGSANLDNDQLSDLSCSAEEEDQGPKRKRQRKDLPRTSKKRTIRNIQRRVRHIVKQAKENPVTFPSFNFAMAVSNEGSTRHKNVDEEKMDTEWLDGNPHVAVSCDQVDLVYFLPNALGNAVHDMLYEALMRFGNAVPLTIGGGADSEGRNVADSYVQRKGELAGLFKLVMCWHGIGNTNKEPVLSRDMIKSGTQFSQSMQLIEDLAFLSHGINAALQAVDPKQFEALVCLRDAVHVKYPYARALATLDPLVMEGRAIMFNRQTPCHLDRLDPLRGWAAMITVGLFDKGGTLWIPRLRLRIRYLPGDVILIRGRILPHEVEAWSGGQRISIAHFTHMSLWNFFGMTCP